MTTLEGVAVVGLVMISGYAFNALCSIGVEHLRTQRQRAAFFALAMVPWGLTVVGLVRLGVRVWRWIREGER